MDEHRIQCLVSRSTGPCASSPDFDGEIDYAPVQEYRGDGVHRYQNFMSSNWSWKQAVSVLLVFLFNFLNIRRI